MRGIAALLLLAMLAAPLAAADPPPDSPPSSDPATPPTPADNATAPPTARATAIYVAGVVVINPFVGCTVIGVGPNPQVDWLCVWRIIHFGP